MDGNDAKKLAQEALHKAAQELRLEPAKPHDLQTGFEGERVDAVIGRVAIEFTSDRRYGLADSVLTLSRHPAPRKLLVLVQHKPGHPAGWDVAKAAVAQLANPDQFAIHVFQLTSSTNQVSELQNVLIKLHRS